MEIASSSLVYSVLIFMTHLLLGILIGWIANIFTNVIADIIANKITSKRFRVTPRKNSKVHKK